MPWSSVCSTWRGLPFRSSLPGEIEVRDECCRIGLEPGAEAWVSSVGGFRTMYEEPYTRVALSEADDAERMTYLPVLASLGGDFKVLLAEATCAITPACFFTATDRGLRGAFPASAGRVRPRW